MKPERAARILAASRTPAQAVKQLKRARIRELKTAARSEKREEEAKRLMPAQQALQRVRRDLIKRGGG